MDTVDLLFFFLPLVYYSIFPSHSLSTLKNSETGCGKTTVVQLLGILLERHLHVVNCHASTETSDLLGGLRPVRRREDILGQMRELVQDLVDTWPDEKAIQDLDVPRFLLTKDKSLPADAPNVMVELVEKLKAVDNSSTNQTGLVPSSSVKNSPGSSRKSKKRLKLTSGDHVDVSPAVDVGTIAAKVKELYQKYNSLFEWCDGPLVTR